MAAPSKSSGINLLLAFIIVCPLYITLAIANVHVHYVEKNPYDEAAPAGYYMILFGDAKGPLYTNQHNSDRALLQFHPISAPNHGIIWDIPSPDPHSDAASTARTNICDSVDNMFDRPYCVPYTNCDGAGHIFINKPETLKESREGLVFEYDRETGHVFRKS